MEAWYFSAESRTLRYGDDRAIEIGTTHTVDGPPVLCERGLHASVRALDALRYAPDPILWRVRLGGVIDTGDDQACATERTYIAGGIDASDMLRRFARRCALDVIDLWSAPDVVRRYLETGDDSFRAVARAAAWAARDAARAAARAAAQAAAWAAARDAAWDAAQAAVWDAARAAVQAAAWDAARAAARDTGWLTAQDRQAARFEAMCRELIA